VRQRDEAADQVRPTSRHPDVGQDQRRAVVASGRDGLVAVDRPTDDTEGALLLEQPGHGTSDAVVVVRDDDGDLTAGRGSHKSKIAYSTAVCRDASAPIA
jgi:hypothetical protein